MRSQRELGAAIRLWRKQNRLSQADLATKLGISQGYMSQVERGDAFSTLNLLCSIADVMEVSLDELVGRAGKPSSSTPQTDGQVALRRMIELILQASPDDRSTLVALLEQYVDG